MKSAQRDRPTAPRRTAGSVGVLVGAAIRHDSGFRGALRRGVKPLLQVGLLFALAHSVLPTWAALPSFGSAEPFREGDVVCFVGDSITHTGSYPILIELFYATRFPERKITYENAGTSGDRAAAIMADEPYRLKADILGRHATVATVMLGMNDVDRASYGPDKTSEKFVAARAKAIAGYQRAMPQLIDRLQASGARLILLTPSTYDDTAAKPTETARFMTAGHGLNAGVNGGLAQFAEMNRGWAEERHAGLADFHAIMTAIDLREQARDPNFTLISVDRIHPGVVGHFVMVYTFLKAQGLEGEVAAVQVDAAAQTTGGSRNCTVTAVQASAGGGLHFDVREKALPFPLPADAKPALALVPFTAEFNREPLVITHLKAGRYRLEIDDAKLGEFSAEELAQGIDLAVNAKAPQVMQSAEAGRIAAELMEAGLKQRDAAINFYQASKAGVNVADATALSAYADKKSAEFVAKKQTPDLRFQRFREALAEPGKFDREAAALREKLHQACQPRLHHVVLTPL